MKRLDESTSCVNLSAEQAVALGARIDDVKRDWAGHSLGVGELAAQLDAVPLLLDAGGFIALKRDGSLVQVTWDSPRVELAVSTARVRDLALISGARRYRELAEVCPQRTLESKACPHCAGTGVAPESGCADAAVVCGCGGLGWMPSTWLE